jgi:hypothetical protein
MRLTDSRSLVVSTQNALSLIHSSIEEFALIAYNGADRDEHQRRVLAKLEKSADGVHINAYTTRELG